MSKVCHPTLILSIIPLHETCFSCFILHIIREACQKLGDNSNLLVQMNLNPGQKLCCLLQPNNVLMESESHHSSDECQTIHQVMQLFSLRVSPCDFVGSYRSFKMSITSLQLPKTASQVSIINSDKTQIILLVQFKIVNQHHCEQELTNEYKLHNKSSLMFISQIVYIHTMNHPLPITSTEMQY